jgi:hypothetical protein
MEYVYSTHWAKGPTFNVTYITLSSSLLFAYPWIRSKVVELDPHVSREKGQNMFRVDHHHSSLGTAGWLTRETAMSCNSG